MTLVLLSRLLPDDLRCGELGKVGMQRKRLRQSRLGGFLQSLFCLTLCLGRFLNKGFYNG